jgi:hypothetical protein
MKLLMHPLHKFSPDSCQKNLWRAAFENLNGNQFGEVVVKFAALHESVPMHTIKRALKQGVEKAFEAEQE